MAPIRPLPQRGISDTSRRVSNIHPLQLLLAEQSVQNAYVARSEQPPWTLVGLRSPRGPLCHPDRSASSASARPFCELLSWRTGRRLQHSRSWTHRLCSLSAYGGKVEPSSGSFQTAKPTARFEISVEVRSRTRAAPTPLNLAHRGISASNNSPMRPKKGRTDSFWGFLGRSSSYSRWHELQQAPANTAGKPHLPSATREGSSEHAMRSRESSAPARPFPTSAISSRPDQAAWCRTNGHLYRSWLTHRSLTPSEPALLVVSTHLINKRLLLYNVTDSYQLLLFVLTPKQVAVSGRLSSAQRLLRLTSLTYISHL
ncbi:hypothetical protein GE09DRAFT_408457 [Coniochaeta sp. 2T2.1]|nr:hypothetical protein GE09DRAFT_408457 [Coniochaeta sp. 2T2.1]